MDRFTFVVILVIVGGFSLGFTLSQARIVTRRILGREVNMILRRRRCCCCCARKDLKVVSNDRACLACVS